MRFLTLTFVLVILFINGFSQQKPVFDNIQNTGNQTFTPDGTWCWFSDPRAVYFEGTHKRTYIGSISSEGSISIGFYDHNSKKQETKVLSSAFEKDDHDNPSIFIDKKGFISVFYGKHAGTEPILRVQSLKPEDISEWSAPQIIDPNDTILYKDLRNSYTYFNPVCLSDENNRMYLFWRGIDGKPSFSVSNDHQKTWETGKIFIFPQKNYAFRRPYTKYATNSKNRIFIAFTDGHPRREPQNSIYFMYIEKGNFYKTDGSLIGPIEKSIEPRHADCVYDATKTNDKAWVWDVCTDDKENGVIVYTKFPNDTTHMYCYARWDGTKWNNYELINSGKWFPQTPVGKTEPEPNYSAGICLDHENPDIVYLSVNRKGVFEIEKWQTSDGGKNWTKEPVTENSKTDQIRPFAVRNAQDGNKLQIIWLGVKKYIHYTNYNTSVEMRIEN